MCVNATTLQNIASKVPYKVCCKTVALVFITILGQQLPFYFIVFILSHALLDKKSVSNYWFCVFVVFRVLTGACFHKRTTQRKRIIIKLLKNMITTLHSFCHEANWTEHHKGWNALNAPLFRKQENQTTEFRQAEFSQAEEQKNKPLTNESINGHKIKLHKIFSPY